MAHHDIVTIGASAGGVEALSRLVAALPDDLPAAVFVVLHVSADAPSVLPSILNRRGRLTACHPVDGQAIERGRIYVAPCGRHIVVKHGAMRVVKGPTENRHRPSIDVLFRSAARAYGPRVVGVLLTGAGDDGVSGLRAIKGRGGIALVQDPADAAVPDLPRAALEHVAADRVLAIAEMGAAIVDAVGQPILAPAATPSEALDKETGIAELATDVLEEDDKVGTPSAFSCPDCGGVLWEVENEDFLRFRCRVGHAYTARALGGQQSESLDRGLWAALRALEENSAFSRRLAVRMRQEGHTPMADRLLQRAEDAAINAEAIREMILRLEDAAVDEAQDDAEHEAGKPTPTA